MSYKKNGIHFFPHSEKLPNWLTIRNLKMNIYLIGSFRHEKIRIGLKKFFSFSGIGRVIGGRIQGEMECQRCSSQSHPTVI